MVCDVDGGFNLHHGEAAEKAAIHKLDRVNCARLRRPYGGLGGSVWVMGEWSVSQWILGVMRFQKIFCLYGVERHKVEKWSGKVGSL